MKSRLLTIAFVLLVFQSWAQIGPDKYFVEFLDKTGTPYSISDPSAFLTQRAIDRRAAQNIAVTEQDLPVNPAYVAGVAALGVTPIDISKWFNGVIIYVPDTSVLASIEELPFVKDIIRGGGKGVTTTVEDKFFLEKQYSRFTAARFKSTGTYDYGPSYWQIHMLNGDMMHDAGYRGEGMVIAVLDGGFQNADILPVFDSLWANNQILGTRDFVNPGNNVFNEMSHGMSVLSTMGGNYPGELIGTAPKAGYWLLRSEDGLSEYLVEEYNWVCAAEYADSVGADIINSSLGYTTFEDSTLNHTWAELDGNTTPVTRGANIAASKGIVVVNSAGNSGNSAWRYIGAPADGNDVLAIAAVDSLMQPASFSSHGWVTASRVKPNVAALGKGTTVAFTDGTFGHASGTSFSSPVIAGMTACLWEARPYLYQSDVRRMIEQSGSQYNDPDTLVGYGIPNFYLILGAPGNGNETRTKLSAYPNPFTASFTLEFSSPASEKVNIEVWSLMGERIYSDLRFPTVKGVNQVTLDQLSGLNPGIYLVRITSEKDGKTLYSAKLEKSVM